MASKILSSRPVVSLPFNALNNSKRRRVAVGHYTNTFNNAKIIATIYRHYLNNSINHDNNGNTSSNADNSVSHTDSIDKNVMKNNIGTALVISLVRNIESVYSTQGLSNGVINGTTSVHNPQKAGISWHNSNVFLPTHTKLVKFLKGCVLRFKVSYTDLDKISLNILKFLKEHSKVFVEKLHSNIYKLVLGLVFTVLGSKIDKKLIGVNNPFLPGGVEELQTIANIITSASSSFWFFTTKLSTANANTSSFSIVDKKVVDRNMNHRHYVS